jgi:anti-sigma regulatory factor (Ser/Thr protein kinase)
MTTAPRRTTAPVNAGGFEHLGYLYRDPKDYLATAVGYVQSALTADNPVLVAVPPPGLEMLRNGLGPDADRVEFADMTVAGRNPSGIIPGVLLEFLHRHPGRRASIIGEPVWLGRERAEYSACVLHEALINSAFAGREASILCPYDARGLPDNAILDAHRTHPVMVDEAGNRWVSGYYQDPLRTAEMLNKPLSSPPAGAPVLSYQHPQDLAGVREFVVAHATEAGLNTDRAGQVAVAVNELATNTIEHTSGPGTVRAWAEPSVLICQVDDTGHLTDRLAGRVPPAPHQPGGRGLLLVNQLSDLVCVYTEPGHTAVRVYHYR